MTRRAPGEGHIRHRKDGRWEACLTLGKDTATGKAKRKAVYARTRREVVVKLGKMREELAGDGLVFPDALTVGGLIERWLEAKARTCRPNTLLSYRHTAKRFIVPHIGAVRVQRLTPMVLHRWVEALSATTYAPPISKARREAGESPAPRPISTRTIRYSLGLLRAVLNSAVRWRLLSRNPATAIDAPRRITKPALIWSRDECRAFLAAAPASRYHAAYLLGLLCGLRRGEVLGLRVSAYNPTDRTVAIRETVIALAGHPTASTPKTERGKRTLEVPAEVCAALDARLVTLAEERRVAEEVGLWRGDADAYVFGSHIGTPTQPRNLLRDFEAVCKRAGVPRIRFHDLRHTYASLAAETMPLAVLSRRLGHHAVSFTLDTYGHAVPGQAEALGSDELLGKAN